MNQNQNLKLPPGWGENNHSGNPWGNAPKQTQNPFPHAQQPKPQQKSADAKPPAVSLPSADAVFGKLKQGAAALRSSAENAVHAAQDKIEAQKQTKSNAAEQPEIPEQNAAPVHADPEPHFDLPKHLSAPEAPSEPVRFDLPEQPVVRERPRPVQPKPWEPEQPRVQDLPQQHDEPFLQELREEESDTISPLIILIPLIVVILAFLGGLLLMRAKQRNSSSAGLTEQKQTVPMQAQGTLEVGDALKILAKQAEQVRTGHAAAEQPADNGAAAAAVTAAPAQTAALHQTAATVQTAAMKKNIVVEKTNLVVTFKPQTVAADNQKAPSAQQPQAAANDVPAGHTDFAAGSPYQDVLMQIYQTNRYGDMEFDPMPGCDITENQFALFDLDGDGTDELIMRWEETCTAGMVEAIFGKQPDGSVCRKGTLGVYADYYSNGIVLSEAYHNQGLAGRLQPYTVLRLNRGTGEYDYYAYVDAWDSQLSWTDGSGNDFPADVDRSGAGIVYYISEGLGGSPGAPMDQADYNAWRDQLLAGAVKYELPWQKFTVNNIRKVTQ